MVLTGHNIILELMDFIFINASTTLVDKIHLTKEYRHGISHRKHLPHGGHLFSKIEVTSNRRHKVKMIALKTPAGIILIKIHKNMRPNFFHLGAYGQRHAKRDLRTYAKNVDPDQPRLRRRVWSGSALFDNHNINSTYCSCYVFF